MNAPYGTEMFSGLKKSNRKFEFQDVGRDSENPIQTDVIKMCDLARQIESQASVHVNYRNKFD